MSALTSLDWKHFYASERELIGESGLETMIQEAPEIAIPESGVVIFPHTRLRVSGQLPAAVAKAVVMSGVETVLAIGVLHGGRGQNAEMVRRARAGDQEARESIRGIHGPGAIGGQAIWEEEFSLDNFSVLVEAASKVLDKPEPQIIARYPFLTVDDPLSLSGFQELVRILENGAALVATADPVHHGAGYGTPAEDRLPRDNEETRSIAKRWIHEGLQRLAERDYTAFLENGAAVRSDFRDAGPVVRELLAEGAISSSILDLTLVNYSDVLESDEPTWVAAALASLERITERPENAKRQ